MSTLIQIRQTQKVREEFFTEIPNDAILNDVLCLIETLFVNNSNQTYIEKLQQARSPMIVISRSESEQILGFKIGYELSDSVFYSWLGGVLPEFRRKGIARSLLKNQHAWCIKNGYTLIRTKTQLHNYSMYNLNRSMGFHVIGNDVTNPLQHKIIMSKILTPLLEDQS